MLKFAHVILLTIELASLLVEKIVLGIELLQVSVKIEIATLKARDSSFRLLLDFFELLSEG